MTRRHRYDGLLGTADWSWQRARHTAEERFFLAGILRAVLDYCKPGGRNADSAKAYLFGVGLEHDLGLIGMGGDLVEQLRGELVEAGRRPERRKLLVGEIGSLLHSLHHAGQAPRGARRRADRASEGA